MADRRCFVQFPHQGEQHKPDGSGHIGWNKTHRNDKPNGHKRKFMEIPGEWMGSDNSLHQDELWAWGGWEAESRLIRELDQPRGNQDCQRFLWQPYYVPRKSYQGLHNTDPFIFGERFLYSNCRQTHSPGLMHLGDGSVIAFGSCKKGLADGWRWWIDTVFVVADSDWMATTMVSYRGYVRVISRENIDFDVDTQLPDHPMPEPIPDTPENIM